MFGQQHLPEPVTFGYTHPVKGGDGVLDHLRPLLVSRIREGPDIEVLVGLVLEVELGSVETVGRAVLVRQGEHVGGVAAGSSGKKLGRDGPYGE